MAGIAFSFFEEAKKSGPVSLPCESDPDKQIYSLYRVANVERAGELVNTINVGIRDDREVVSQGYVRYRTCSPAVLKDVIGNNVNASRAETYSTLGILVMDRIPTYINQNRTTLLVIIYG